MPSPPRCVQVGVNQKVNHFDFGWFHFHGFSCCSFSFFTCGLAGSRFLESQRSDSLFVDVLASKLAGREGLAQPMGDWIMVPRTRFGDDFVFQHYMKPRGARQLVLLGAGMDARAYRLRLPELKVFEVGCYL